MEELNKNNKKLNTKNEEVEIELFVYNGYKTKLDNKIKFFKIKNINKLFILYIFILLIFLILMTKTGNSNKEIMQELIKNVYLKGKKNDLKKIKIGLFYETMYNGGIQRAQSIMAREFININKYEVYIFSQFTKLDFELHHLAHKVNSYKSGKILKDVVNKTIIKENIDILIFSSYNSDDLNFLLGLKKKTIVFSHTLYIRYLIKFPNFLKVAKNASLFLTLVPDSIGIFHSLGFNNVLAINNFLLFDQKKIKRSTLASKNILLIGRARDRNKRFYKAIKAMKYIVNEVPDAQLLIFSKKKLEKMVHDLNLDNNVKFMGYIKNQENYLKDAAIHILPSKYEAFPSVMAETKSYGIPNINIGKYYLTLAKNGTINVPENDTEAIARESIKLLKNNTYRYQKGKEAFESMGQFSNKYTLKKWDEIITSLLNNNISLLLAKEIKNYNGCESAKLLIHDFKKLKRKKTNKVEYDKIIKFFNKYIPK